MPTDRRPPDPTSDPLTAELERLDDLGAEMTRRARAAGVQLFWRAQSRASRRAVVREGRAESVSASSVAGHGVQVVTPEGYTVLGSRDDFLPEPALTLLRETVDAAAAGGRLGLERSPLPELEPCRERCTTGAPWSPEEVDLGRVVERLVELEAELAGRVPGPKLQLSFRAELDAWRICRSDGTDVLFAMPRCSLSSRATSASGGSRHSVSATVFHTRPDLPWDEATVAQFLQRSVRAAELARDLPDAPTFPAGSYPLVIDYALAKGLAHEAFGHASEADGFRSSVLAEKGRFKSGESVGADHVSIVDEPLRDDHAWQPISANGVPRRRVQLVRQGKLAEALSDPWSAAAGGVPQSGAARAESFRNAPLPRMTNIRIEVDDPLEAAGEFEDYGPEEVRDLLQQAGVFRRHPRVVYLSGYTGGQVNTTSGDFVFNCRAIYALEPRGITFHRPAIFSGSMFGALRSIREAFGPLRLDATGWCGKWGQSVPSSGGSHYFLVLDQDPTVRLGGR